MCTTIVLGDGPLGRAVGAALRGARRRRPRSSAGPPSGRHDPAALARRRRRRRRVARATRSPANVGGRARRRLPPASSSRRPAGTRTGRAVERAAARATARPRSSRRTSASASRCSAGSSRRRSRCSGRSTAFDPYLVEWHRRAKRDRPSGTARELARRIVAGHPRLATRTTSRSSSIRAGASPGMHLVGFDAAGETSSCA